MCGANHVLRLSSVYLLKALFVRKWPCVLSLGLRFFFSFFEFLQLLCLVSASSETAERIFFPCVDKG